jgi:hypothetical protein
MKCLKLFGFSILAAFLYAGADPFVGTWKLDSDRSKFSSTGTSFMFATIQVESAGSGLKSTASAADGEGLASDFTFNSPLDGTPSKVIAATSIRGSSAVDTVSLKRIDDHTITATGSKNGRLVFSDKRVVSTDGMTMTITRNGITPEGRKYQSTIVLVRFR